MTCAEIQVDLSLYLYGELDFAAEESIEVHLAECAYCQLALNREKEWHAMVNRQQEDVSPEWLADCRKELYEQIRNEPTTAAHARHKIEGWLRRLFDIRLTDRSYRLAGASFLVLLGFGAGRMVNSFSLTSDDRPMLNASGLIQPSIRQVRQVQPESGNRVRIIVQEIRTHEVSGSRDSDDVRTLLMGAARESQDPGVRMDSVEMLAGQSGFEIRNAILNTVKNDPNAAVRVKAIESLRQFPSDASIREVLESAMAHDADAGVRAEAMDVLVPSDGQVQVTPQLLQTLSNVMRSSQSDDYVRLRCTQILHGQSSVNGIY